MMSFFCLTNSSSVSISVEVKLGAFFLFCWKEHNQRHHYNWMKLRDNYILWREGIKLEFHSVKISKTNSLAADTNITKSILHMQIHIKYYIYIVTYARSLNNCFDSDFLVEPRGHSFGCNNHSLNSL